MSCKRQHPRINVNIPVLAGDNHMATALNLSSSGIQLEFTDTSTAALDAEMASDMLTFTLQLEDGEGLALKGKVIYMTWEGDHHCIIGLRFVEPDTDQQALIEGLLESYST